MLETFLEELPTSPDFDWGDYAFSLSQLCQNLFVWYLTPVLAKEDIAPGLRFLHDEVTFQTWDFIVPILVAAEKLPQSAFQY